jgi:ribosome-binding factor A
MTIRKISRAELRGLCSEVGPDDGLDPRLQRRHSAVPRTSRKTLQLCSAVARTLAAVFAESGDDVLRELVVEAVAAAPRSARLLVTVSAAAPSEFDSDQAAERLERARGRLRTEVAAAVRRRRAPDLVFRVVTS